MSRLAPLFALFPDPARHLGEKKRKKIKGRVEDCNLPPRFRGATLSFASALFFFFFVDSADDSLHSANPINRKAAERWDRHMDEFKRQVLARHRDLEDEEE